jgi:two-component system, OmpR family, sensor histidine kinase CiaH
VFSAARVRLTLWYLAILAAIVGLLSLALYRILVSLQQAELRSLGPTTRHGVAGLFARDERGVVLQIVALDAGVLVLATLGAYILAGRTLAPIEQAMERQQRFAAAASHELRTPLTILQGSMEVALLNRRTHDEYERILRQAADEARRMGVLVADLLTLARAQRDTEALKLEMVDLRDIVRQAATTLCPLVERKGLVLEVRMDRPLLIQGDALKLRQAVSNLLDNAVSYTPVGGMVRIGAGIERDQVHMQIGDSGPGIAAVHLPHLFEPFYRVGDGEGESGGHAGLGLALAAWIVRAHGGHLAVASSPGAGSVFTMTLPAAA